MRTRKVHFVNDYFVDKQDDPDSGESLCGIDDTWKQLEQTKNPREVTCERCRREPDWIRAMEVSASREAAAAQKARRAARRIGTKVEKSVAQTKKDARVAVTGTTTRSTVAARRRPAEAKKFLRPAMRKGQATLHKKFSEVLAKKFREMMQESDPKESSSVLPHFRSVHDLGSVLRTWGMCYDLTEAVRCIHDAGKLEILEEGDEEPYLELLHRAVRALNYEIMRHTR